MSCPACATADSDLADAKGVREFWDGVPQECFTFDTLPTDTPAARAISTRTSRRSLPSIVTNLRLSSNPLVGFSACPEPWLQFECQEDPNEVVDTLRSAVLLDRVEERLLLAHLRDDAGHGSAVLIFGKLPDGVPVDDVAILRDRQGI